MYLLLYFHAVCFCSRLILTESDDTGSIVVELTISAKKFHPSQLISNNGKANRNSFPFNWFLHALSHFIHPVCFQTLFSHPTLAVLIFILLNTFSFKNLCDFYGVSPSNFLNLQRARSCIISFMKKPSEHSVASIQWFFFAKFLVYRNQYWTFRN